MSTHALTAPAAQAPLSVWLDYLLAIHPTEIDMGLDRVASVARELGLTELGRSKVITVAGTNGKGSTCALIEAALTLADRSVGVYSSPHLLHFNERIRIKGKDASDGDIVAAFEAIENARGSTSLTFFEYGTLAALYLFKQAQLDVILLEVGLGGRLDATNIIDPDLAVITSIDLDHQEYLGDTRELIAIEKAGICRKGKPVILGEADRPHTLIETVQAQGAKPIAVGQDFSYQLNSNQSSATSWSYQGPVWQWKALALPQLPLPNAATAIAVLEQFDPTINPEHVKQAIAQTRLNGRLECVSHSPTVLLDVAHNPHAARYLLSQLQMRQPRRLIALCGMLQDKDQQQVLSIFAPHVAHWYLCDLNVARGAKAASLAAQLPADAQYRVFDSIALAWDCVKQQSHSDDLVIVFGSFYTVAGVKALLEGNNSAKSLS